MAQVLERLLWELVCSSAMPYQRCYKWYKQLFCWDSHFLHNVHGKFMSFIQTTFEPHRDKNRPFAYAQNKDADQLRGDREADQRLCLCYTDSIIPLQMYFLNPNFKPLGIFCDCTAPFVSDLVGNPEDRFSQNEAHFSLAGFT